MQPVMRPSIPVDKRSWAVQWPEYSPPYVVSATIIHQVGGEKENRGGGVTWCCYSVFANTLSDAGAGFLQSGEKELMTAEEKKLLPRNVSGRTGLRGRGIFPNWGESACSHPPTYTHTHTHS